MCKCSSKSNKMLILGPILPNFWIQWSLNDWFKLLRPNVICSFLLLYRLLLGTYSFLVVTYSVTSGYLIATTGYFSLLLIPRFGNNANVLLSDNANKIIPQFLSLPVILLTLTLNVPIPDKVKKIKLNFYFHTSLWCLKRFYEGL